MRPILLLVCLLVSAALRAQEPYPLGPDSQVQNVPHGTVEKLVLPPGQFFPGTPHNYAVYIPANAPVGPLPYMVFLDGSQYLGNGLRTANVLDNLIAAKAIPPMVGVFVDPGVLPAIRPDAQNRYERVFEYDSLSNRYSRFLLEELLPAVAKKHALSSNPDEHAIGGTSTGAVGAFVAAWHRPDQFHRVLSLIGTYVAMKGADTLPEIVRKTEAKPIRIWMQDGANDHITAAQPYGTFYAGTWPKANQLLFDALQFQGYDAKLTIGTGAHDTKQGGAELPDALRWLWRGYSAESGVDKVTVKPPAALGGPGWDKRGSAWATVEAVGNWEPVALSQQASNFTPVVMGNGDVVVDGAGSLTRIHGNSAVTISSGRQIFGPMVAGSNNDIYIGDIASREVVLFDLGGGAKEKLIQRNTLADSLVWDGAGRLYFLDTHGGKEENLGVLDLRGKSVGWQVERPPANGVSGLALSPDRGTLVVTNIANRHQWSMQLQADGTPANAEPFYRLEVLDDDGGATGAAFDSVGQVYFATALGIQVCEANGRVAMILSSPVVDKPVESIAFGGPERDWLYAVVDGKLFRRKMKVHAVPVDTPVKPPQPPL
jgi:enterochelin esterase-like enzyme/sugar lactone lactonase YvrE